MPDFLKRIPASVLALLEQMGFSGAQFLLSLALVRLLSPADFGRWSAALMGLYFLLNISQSLLLQPFATLQSKGERESQPFHLLLFLLAFSGGLLGLSVLLAGLPFVAVSLQEILLPATLWALGFLWFDFFRKLFLAQNQLWKALILTSVQVLVQVLVLAAFSWWKMSDLALAFEVLALAYLIPVLLFLPVFFRSHESFQNLPRTWTNHWQQGRWLLPGSLVQWTSGHWFSFCAGTLLGLEALGAFRLVQSVFGLLNLVFQTFENHLLPEVARRFAQNQQAARTFLRQSFRRQAFPLVLLLLAMALFSKPLMGLLAPSAMWEFHYLIQGMAVLYALVLFGYPIRIRLRLLGKESLLFRGSLLSLVASLALGYSLVQYGQLPGALLGLLLNQLLQQGFWQWSLWKQAKTEGPVWLPFVGKSFQILEKQKF